MLLIGHRYPSRQQQVFLVLEVALASSRLPLHRRLLAYAASGHAATPEQRDEIAPVQLIELHSIPASQEQLARYRFIEDQSAGIRLGRVR
jgi:hypothetical protein